MFVILIEKAFKHGCSCVINSLIHINNKVYKQRNIYKKQNTQHLRNWKTVWWRGLDNVRKRLSLVYGDNAKLQINNQPDTYSVKLEILVA